MKKSIILFIAIMMPMFLFGQSYKALWSQVNQAEEKDLPQTEYQALQKIVKKATKEKVYGHLLKAQLQAAQVMAEITPDSLKPTMDDLKQHVLSTNDEVLRLIWHTVLYRVSSRNPDLELKVDRPQLTDDLCKKLVQVKDEAYDPVVIKGADAGIFNHDLLHVVGYELDDYRLLHEYYKKAGNRRAACITASEVFSYASVEELDSLIAEYQDLPESGELAIRRYQRIAYKKDVPMADKLAYLQEAQKRWKGWKRISVLTNYENDMTNPQFRLHFDRKVAQPQMSQQVKLEELRNLKSLTMKVYRVNAKGDIDDSPSYDEGYKKIKPLLGEVVQQEERTYEGHPPYELFEDSFELKALPIGVYMVEFKTNPSTEVERSLYFVTDVYTIAEPQPQDESIRYVVVSASTGQPIAGAKLHIREKVAYNKWVDYDATTDAKGEYVFKAKDADHRMEAFAYTDADTACPPLEGTFRYSYYGDQIQVQKACIYTDRAIYRPGQTVHASVILYNVVKGWRHSVRAEAPVTLTLRDANYKVVAEQRLTTDQYGTATADFTLPSSGLTGRFTLRADNQSYSFRVEEYKRPTFHVDFPEVKESYQAGDTLTVKGKALTFAGVPVQGAKVSYKVSRRTAFWWWSYSRYWDMAALNYRSQGDEICCAEVVTNDDGTFDVQMPLELPETSYPMFYHFVVTADVTDTAGETHHGEMSLPLGNRKQALSVSLPEKILLEDDPKLTFHLLNAAGTDLDAEVKYRIDGGKWLTAKTASDISLTSIRSLSLPKGSPLTSGKHTLEAVCANDSISRDFVLFSLDDEKPVTETDDWFYQSASQFPNDGTPVTVQVGSSAKDMHIVYSIFSGKTLIEQGAYDKSNALVNLKLTYKDDYENGLLLTFAWVKNGRCYTHTATIRRPLPDKRLRMEWTTFRNRLTPGQQEEWTLTIKDADGKPVDAQLMATLYDQSLDQLQKHSWSLVPPMSVAMPHSAWSFNAIRNVGASGYFPWRHEPVDDLVFSRFDDSIFPSFWNGHFRRYSRGAMMGAKYDMLESAGMVLDDAPMMAKSVARETNAMVEESADMAAPQAAEAETPEEETAQEQVQMRENLNETAFFYPQLVTNQDGSVALKFTLPESLTTWRFMGIAHTKDMHYGSLQDEAIAQKDVMIQPNMPRFLREGDEATISARIFNTSDKPLKGKATLKFLDPETNKVLLEQTQDVELNAGATTPVVYNISLTLRSLSLPKGLLICQMAVSANGYTDGEQHYLPILPSKERVTVAVPITQHQPGEAKVDLSALIPSDATNGKFTLEYTNHPAWLMIQALPALGHPADDNAISQAASYYANALGQYIISQNPQAKTAFTLWKNDGSTGSPTAVPELAALDQRSLATNGTQEGSTLNSQLEKNEDLKNLLLTETPWVLDAERESEQRQRLADFFDENLMQNRLGSAIEKLQKLQTPDGAWTWWKDMPGSFYMTVAVSEMLVRLNAMAGTQTSTQEMLNAAFKFMGREVVDEVKELKKLARKGHKVSFPSFKCLQWLYLATLDGRELPADVVEANNYLLKLLKKDIKSQSIYEKALTAVILSKSDPQRALEYVQSLKEYTVYREEMGRYYDTPRAGYSWYDYKIPTQTVAIEALQRLTPDDRQTIEEMQRWLLMSKRTQAWDTPINSVNAVYAFLDDSQNDGLRLDAENATMKIDDKVLDLPKATAAIGYVKTNVPAESKQLTIEKTSSGTSWGAVYAQFFQPTKSILDSGSGLTVKREILGTSVPEPAALDRRSLATNGTQEGHLSPLKVGDRVRVRITITADRDYDFVQVIEKRAACMEPIHQLSGWHQGSYCTPRDCSTNYYFDCLSKGKHVIENEYYIDRSGTYETGTCTVECAYAPEFRATTSSITLNIK